MKAIFNSLGSNYSFSFALFSLSRLFVSDSRAIMLLEKKLQKMFGGEVHTFYKGRDAIEYSLRVLGIGRGDVVLTQAFTCKAVEEGISRSGAKPHFVDVEKGSLNLSLRTLESAFKKDKSIRAVLVQHTLGYTAEISSIREWCDTKRLILIEDLAHSIGGRDDSGKKLGSEADVVILSFGRDKMVDAVSGGACIIKLKSKSLKLKSVSFTGSVPLINKFQDLIYPLLTFIIRNTYVVGFGKLLHFLMRITGIISSPVESKTKIIRRLPASHASLALKQLEKLNDEIKHRQTIANFYKNNLPEKLILSKLNYIYASPLRFPITVEKPEDIVLCMKIKRIYLADRWYKKPVDVGSSNSSSIYQIGSCPIAEGVSNQIINLPTHQGVSVGDAKRIVSGIKSCLK